MTLDVLYWRPTWYTFGEFEKFLAERVVNMVRLSELLCEGKCVFLIIISCTRCNRSLVNQEPKYFACSQTTVWKHVIDCYARHTHVPLCVTDRWWVLWLAEEKAGLTAAHLPFFSSDTSSCWEWMWLCNKTTPCLYSPCDCDGKNVHLAQLTRTFFFSFPLAFFHQHVLASLLNVIFSVTHRSSGHVILTFIKPLVTRISAAQQGPKALNVWTLVWRMCHCAIWDQNI